MTEPILFDIFILEKWKTYSLDKEKNLLKMEKLLKEVKTQSGLSYIPGLYTLFVTFIVSEMRDYGNDSQLNLIKQLLDEESPKLYPFLFKEDYSDFWELFNWVKKCRNALLWSAFLGYRYFRLGKINEAYNCFDFFFVRCVTW